VLPAQGDRGDEQKAEEEDGKIGPFGVEEPGQVALVKARFNRHQDCEQNGPGGERFGVFLGEAAWSGRNKNG
jgi:hypothetical protein